MSTKIGSRLRQASTSRRLSEETTQGARTVRRRSVTRKHPDGQSPANASRRKCSAARGSKATKTTQRSTGRRKNSAKRASEDHRDHQEAGPLSQATREVYVLLAKKKKAIRDNDLKAYSEALVRAMHHISENSGLALVESRVWFYKDESRKKTSPPGSKTMHSKEAQEHLENIQAKVAQSLRGELARARRPDYDTEVYDGLGAKVWAIALKDGVTLNVVLAKDPTRRHEFILKAKGS